MIHASRMEYLLIPFSRIPRELHQILPVVCIHITTIFDAALSEFEKKESIDIPYDWHESSSIPMETDNEGNFIGFLYCEEYFASEGEKFRTTIQNSLIEEEEHRKQFKKGMKMFFFSV